MEQLLPALLNTGGMGVLAAALLFLHREALRSFSTTIDKERQAFREEMAAERAVCERQHTESMTGHKETRHAIKDVAQAVALLGALARIKPPPAPDLDGPPDAAPHEGLSRK